MVLYKHFIEISLLKNKILCLNNLNKLIIKNHNKKLNVKIKWTIYKR